MAKKGKRKPPAELRLARIKKLVIIAMFSDDELMPLLVLKGGNALDVVHRISTRASIDVDFSMECEFPHEQLDDVRSRITTTLRETFRLEGFEVFDVTLEEKPKVVSPDLAHFWGGYLIEFKLIEAEKFVEYSHDLQALRRNAILMGARGKFQVEISKFEYCAGKQQEDLEGYRIFVYTPQMIVCEKLRAICQQMPEYGHVVKRTRPGAARARDFVDIHTVVEHFGLDTTNPESGSMLVSIFEAKRVPLQWLAKVGNYREFHRPDFEVVMATVKPGVKLRVFDFYFDYVVDLCQQLKPFWDV